MEGRGADGERDTTTFSSRHTDSFRVASPAVQSSTSLTAVRAQAPGPKECGDYGATGLDADGAALPPHPAPSDHRSNERMHVRLPAEIGDLSLTRAGVPRRGGSETSRHAPGGEGGTERSAIDSRGPLESEVIRLCTGNISCRVP